MTGKVDSSIIERIRKLLAMAGDASSPNEAAIAARRAESMMRKYNLESADLIFKDLKKKENIIQQAARGNIWRKKARSIPKWSQTLAVYCAELFDCHVVIAQSYADGPTFRFMGYKTDVEVCIWTFSYLMQQCKRFAEAYAIENPWTNRAMRMAYHDGVTQGIGHNLTEAKRAKDDADRGNSTSTALVVAKRAAVEEVFGVVGYNYKDGKERSGASAAAFFEGIVDGQSVNVNPNVLDSSGPGTKAIH